MNRGTPTVFILLLLLDISFCLVPSPSNVTIQCHNFRTVAYWNYSQPSLRPQFIVGLKLYSGGHLEVPNCLNITHHHCDVSKLVLSSIQETFFLTIKAVVGFNQSAEKTSSEFTYNANKVEEIHCTLDFPHVNLSVSHDMLKIQFPHPRVYYQEALQHFPKKKYKRFYYKVTSGAQEDRLECEKDPCEGLVSAPGEGQKPCILLNGEMNNILLKSAGEVCLQPQNWTTEPVPKPPGGASLTVPLVGAGAALMAFTVLAFLMFKRKTNGSSAIPKIMASVLTNHQGGRLLQPESDPTTDVLSVAPRPKPETEPLCEPLHTDTLVPKEGSRFPIGMKTECNSISSQTYDGLGGSAEESRRVEEEERVNGVCRTVESSGYDRPHVMEPAEMVPIEISPGDLVQAYRQAQA